MSELRNWEGGVCKFAPRKKSQWYHRIVASMRTNNIQGSAPFNLTCPQNSAWLNRKKFTIPTLISSSSCSGLNQYTKKMTMPKNTKNSLKHKNSYTRTHNVLISICAVALSGCHAYCSNNEHCNVSFSQQPCIVQTKLMYYIARFLIAVLSAPAPPPTPPFTTAQNDESFKRLPG